MSGPFLFGGMINPRIFQSRLACQDRHPPPVMGLMVHHGSSSESTRPLLSVHIIYNSQNLICPIGFDLFQHFPSS
jgi:hypothetical protein